MHGQRNIKSLIALFYILNPFNAELNPICHLLALLGAHHIFHVSGLRVNFIDIPIFFLSQFTKF
jgi:hypothetical protein